MRTPLPLALSRWAMAAAILVLAGCATSTIDVSEPRRLLGTENDVRVDAQLGGDRLALLQQIPITYAITNNRPTSIAFAELVPETSYDPDTHVVTLGLGTEVPGHEFLPRLVEIGPGQKKTFSAGARVVIPSAGGEGGLAARATGIQLKVSFLNDVEPFRQLVGISERAVRDPDLANQLFGAWIERNETIVTNVVPMRWSPPATGDEPAPRRP